MSEDQSPCKACLHRWPMGSDTLTCATLHYRRRCGEDPMNMLKRFGLTWRDKRLMGTTFPTAFSDLLIVTCPFQQENQ